MTNGKPGSKEIRFLCTEHSRLKQVCAEKSLWINRKNYGVDMCIESLSTSCNFKNRIRHTRISIHNIHGPPNSEQIYTNLKIFFHWLLIPNMCWFTYQNHKSIIPETIAEGFVEIHIAHVVQVFRLKMDHEKKIIFRLIKTRDGVDFRNWLLSLDICSQHFWLRSSIRSKMEDYSKVWDNVCKKNYESKRPKLWKCT